MKRSLLPLLTLLALLAGGCNGGSSDSDGTGNSAPQADALTVSVTPQDAQIVVEDANGGIVALPDDDENVPLAAGSYTVAVHRVGYVSEQRQAQVSGGTRLTVRLQDESPVQGLPGGPLRISATNPLYFEDDRDTHYLAGIHTWNNLIDMGTTQPPREFDFPAYVSFLLTHGANVIRLWAWETPHPDDRRREFRDWAAPHPWLRTGPGQAVDGLPKFDLDEFDEAYFVRMRERVRALQDQGIYVIVMLFEGWSIQNSPGRDSHPFTQENNINGIDDGGSLRRIYTLQEPDIVDLQEAYVRKVVDTLNDLDNVLYEIANEAVSESVDWQYHMIDFVRSYQRSKPKEHSVGMTWPLSASDSVLFNGPADWVSPRNEQDGAKIILSDNDHLGGADSGDEDWVWRTFTRGQHVLFMDCYEPPDSLCDTVYQRKDEIRRAVGATVRYARRMDLASAVPSPGLASSGHCLASDAELVVWVPSGGRVTVDLPAAPRPYQAEWYEPATNIVRGANPVDGGAPRDFDPPFGGPAVLFLWLP